MILPESPDQSVESSAQSDHIYDGTGDPIVVEGTKSDWANLFRKAVERYPEPHADPVQLADGIEELKRGNLYDISYQDMRATGFFCRFEGDKAVFFCFNYDCQGDYLFFPSERIIAVEHPEQNLASLARTIYFECDKIKWLIEFMRWDNDADFVISRARRC